MRCSCSAFVLISIFGISVVTSTSGWISSFTCSITFSQKELTLKDCASQVSSKEFFNKESSCIWFPNCFRASIRACMAFACLGAVICNPATDLLISSSVGSICADILWMNPVCCSLCSVMVWMIFFNFRFRSMKRMTRNARNANAAIRMAANVQSPAMIYCLADSWSSFSCIVCRLLSYFCAAS